MYMYADQNQGRFELWQAFINNTTVLMRHSKFIVQVPSQVIINLISINIEEDQEIV